MRRYGAAVLVGALLATSACGGGGGGDRPSKDEISKALRKGGDDSLLGSAAANVNKKTADCIAEVLVDSKLSDKALKALIKGDKTYKGTKSDQAAAGGIATKMGKCVAENTTSN